MIVPGSANALLLRSAAPTGYNVERSLRFNSSDSAYCSRVAVTPTDATKFTLSFWVKRAKLGVEQVVMYAGVDSANKVDRICFLSNDTIELRQRRSNVDYTTTTSAVFRDCSAWYHIVYSWSSGTRTLYVNGVSQAFASNSTTTATHYWQTSGVTQYLGRDNNEGGSPYAYGDFYLADVHFIDGQALTPSSFTEVSATTGQLIPKAYSGTYGTNGFHLPFSDNSTAAALGTDTSGNGNDWTVNNLSVEAFASSGTTNISTVASSGFVSGGTTVEMVDSSTSTYYNALDGGIEFSSDVSGYFKTIQARGAGGNCWHEYYDASNSLIYTSPTTNLSSGVVTTLGPYYVANVRKVIAKSNATGSGSDGHGIYAFYINNSLVNTNSNSATSFTFGAVLGAGNDSLVDTPTSYGTDTGAGGEVRGNYCTWNPLINGDTAANGNLDVTNDTARGTQKLLEYDAYWEITSTGGTTTAGVVSDGGTTNTTTVADGKTYGFKLSAAGALEYINITDGGIFTSITTGLTGIQFPYASAALTTASLNAGQRPFAATAPSGFKALCTTNLPAPVVAQPSTVMDVKLYTGNGGTQTISGLGFSPDLVWLKVRSAAVGHGLFDQVRGAGKALYSHATNAEYDYGTTSSGELYQFNSDGFNLGSFGVWNVSSQTSVAWCWDAGSSTVTNTQGSITSQVRANASSGFSIATFTAPSSGSATIGHGLGVEPHMIIIKSRDQAYNWCVYHKALTSNAYFLNLNTTAAQSNASNIWNNTTPTSTVFSLGSGYAGAGATVAYLFSPVAGYSSFGSITGNGSADGPFIYLGFRPKFFMYKRIDAATDWWIDDGARNSYNVVNKTLFPNLSSAEVTSNFFDFTANGVKVRDRTDANTNANGGTYIYAAFAESPFQYARAR